MRRWSSTSLPGLLLLSAAPGGPRRIPRRPGRSARSSCASTWLPLTAWYAGAGVVAAEGLALQAAPAAAAARTATSIASRAAASSNRAATTFGLLVRGQRRRLLLRCVTGSAQRLRLHQVARRQVADQPRKVPRAICRLPSAFGRVRRRAGQRGLGLGHVGAGDLADPEALVGGLQLLGQHLLVVDVAAPAAAVAWITLT